MGQAVVASPLVRDSSCTPACRPWDSCAPYPVSAQQLDSRQEAGMGSQTSFILGGFHSFRFQVCLGIETGTRGPLTQRLCFLHTRA